MPACLPSTFVHRPRFEPNSHQNLPAGLLDFVLHLDEHLGRIIVEQGTSRAYALLAAIVFCETGLVRNLLLFCFGTGI